MATIKIKSADFSEYLATMEESGIVETKIVKRGGKGRDTLYVFLLSSQRTDIFGTNVSNVSTRIHRIQRIQRRGNSSRGCLKGMKETKETLDTLDTLATLDTMDTPKGTKNQYVIFQPSTATSSVSR